MHRAITLLLVSGSLLGATALAACGSSDSTPPAAAAATAPAQTATPEQTATPAPSATKEPATSGKVAADIKDFAFAPRALKVKVGQTITWTNSDAAAHTVTAKSGASFDSGSIAQGATYSWKATKAGTVSYICAIHPSMVGTITVQ